jgi:hypothetical protein
MLHLLLAARLFDDTGRPDRATDARQRSSAVLLRTADQTRIESEVAAWKPDALVELPAEDANPS